MKLFSSEMETPLNIRLRIVGWASSAMKPKPTQRSPANSLGEFVYSADSISKPHASRSGSGMNFEFLL